MPAAIDLIKQINETDRADDMPWRERIHKKKLEMDLLGHNAVVLDKMQKEIAIQQQGLRSLQSATSAALGVPTQGDPQESEGDAMGVNIGDQINYYIDDRDATNKQPSGLSTLAKTGIAAAIGTGLLGGIGGPVIGALLANRTSKPAAVQPYQNTDTDTDTRSQPTVTVHD